MVGFGTFPDASTNFTLSNGAYHDIIRAYPVAHVIQRNYSLRVRFLHEVDKVNV
jgi:tyrosinase